MSDVDVVGAAPATRQPRRSGVARLAPPPPAPPPAAAPAEPSPGTGLAMGRRFAARTVASSAPASGPRVDPNTKPARTSEEQREASLYFEAIGEVRQAVSARGALLSGCTLQIGYAPTGQHEDGIPARDADGNPVPAPDGQPVNVAVLTLAENLLADIQDSMGNHTALIDAQSQNWDVTGEAYMCAWWENARGIPTVETDPLAVRVRWEVVGPNAYHRDGARQFVQLSQRAPKILLPPDALAWRMWKRHPQFPDDAWSWVMSSLTICRSLLAYQLAERAQALSAAAGKIHIVPADAAPAAPVNQGAASMAPPRMMTGDEWAAKLDEQIAEVIGEILDDWQSGRAVQGGVLAIESKWIEKFGKVIDIGRAVDAELGNLTDRALQRLKESADCSPEMISGLGDTNRWNGAQIDDADYRRYHRPQIWGIANSWTSELIWPGVVGSGYTLDEARQFVIIVNTAGVVADPDQTALAHQAIHDGSIGWEGYNLLSKIPPEYAPTPEERQEIHEFFITRGPTAGGGGGDSGPPATVQPVNQAAGAIHAPRLVSHGSQLATRRTTSRDHLGARLHQIEFATRAALIAASNVAFDAATNRAGAKLRNLARRQLRVEVPLELSGRQIVEHLGHAETMRLVAASTGTDPRARREEMFAAALVALRPHYRSVVDDGLAEMLTAMGVQHPTSGRPGRSPFTAATISVDDLAAAADQGWETLSESLSMWADETMFSEEPDPEADTVRGVPVPVFRRTLAAVGGTGVAAGWTAMRVGSSTSPAELGSSMAFGPRLAVLQPDVAQWEWFYGTAPRRVPFPEHEDLDGQVITGPDDPVLAGAPWGSYWPGDHYGDLCDVVPTFASADA